MSVQFSISINNDTWEPSIFWGGIHSWGARDAKNSKIFKEGVCLCGNR